MWNPMQSGLEGELLSRMEIQPLGTQGGLNVKIGGKLQTAATTSV